MNLSQLLYDVKLWVKRPSGLALISLPTTVTPPQHIYPDPVDIQCQRSSDCPRPSSGPMSASPWMTSRKDSLKKVVLVFLTTERKYPSVSIGLLQKRCYPEISQTLPGGAVCVCERECPSRLPWTLNGLCPSRSQVQSLCYARLSLCMNRAGCCQEGLSCLPVYCNPPFQWCCRYAQIHVILISMPKKRSPLQMSPLYRWAYPAGESASGPVSLLLCATCARGQTLANI